MFKKILTNVVKDAIDPLGVVDFIKDVRDEFTQDLREEKEAESRKKAKEEAREEIRRKEREAAEKLAQEPVVNKSAEEEEEEVQEEEDEDLEVTDRGEVLDYVYSYSRGKYALRRKADKAFVTEWYEDLHRKNKACGYVYLEDVNDGTYGIVNNKTGKITVKKFQLLEITAYGDDLVIAMNKNEHEALYDADGHRVTDWMHSISKLKKSGYALACNKDDEYGVLDKEGNLVFGWGERKAAKQFMKE